MRIGYWYLPAGAGIHPAELGRELEERGADALFLGEHTNLPEGVAEQQYPPDELVGRDYYQPTQRGAERAIADRVPKLRRAIRGDK